MSRVLESFQLVRDRLPSFLSTEALGRVERIAGRVPEQARSHYLEFRLNGTTEVDFLTFVTSKSAVSEFRELLGPNPSSSWRRNLEVLGAWEAEDGALSALPFFSLEYDAGDRFVVAEPEASLSPGIDAQHLMRHVLDHTGETAETRALARTAYAVQLPAANQRAFLTALDRVYDALPRGGAIPHAPVMSAREPIVAKPYVVLPRAELFGFLERIDWPGSMSALSALLETYYAPFQKTVYLDLTVTDRVHSRLGLVTSQFQAREADFKTLDWWRIPAHLHRYKDELRHWRGWAEVTLQGQRVWMHRWLDTKAVLYDSEVEYKAYLGFSPSRPPLFS